MIISNSLVGSVYVSGGAVDLELSNYVDVVDLSSGERSRGPSMRHPRLGHAAADSPTLLFVFGGVDHSGMNSCEAFNPQTRQ